MEPRDPDLVQYARSRREKLSAWSTPADFEAVVEELRERVGAYTIFRKPMWSFWRDAWTLGRFAHLIGADAVQFPPVTEQYPDGRVKVGSETWDVEVTEAMMPDRRRANEYAPDAPTVRPDPVEGWDTRLDNLPHVLDRVIRQKANKQYKPPPTLVVYLNIGAYGDYREAETRSCVAETKAQYAGGFAAIHILWGQELM